MRASRRGGRSDPVSSRLYRPGDDLRLIDRHASARLAAARGSGDLIVREHFAEEAARVALVVDPSPSMQLFPPAMLARIGAAAKLTFAKTGVYRFTTKPGEDYMAGMKTVGADNVLKLTVVVR